MHLLNAFLCQKYICLFLTFVLYSYESNGIIVPCIVTCGTCFGLELCTCAQNILIFTVLELCIKLTPCSLGLSATSQQYSSVRTNQPPATSQQYSSVRTNQHQPLATSQPNRLLNYVFTRKKEWQIEEVA
jgi:hypothetical protein